MIKIIDKAKDRIIYKYTTINERLIVRHNILSDLTIIDGDVKRLLNKNHFQELPSDKNIKLYIPDECAFVNLRVENTNVISSELKEAEYRLVPFVSTKEIINSIYSTSRIFYSNGNIYRIPKGEDDIIKKLIAKNMFALEDEISGKLYRVNKNYEYLLEGPSIPISLYSLEKHLDKFKDRLTYSDYKRFKSLLSVNRTSGMAVDLLCQYGVLKSKLGMYLLSISGINSNALDGCLNYHVFCGERLGVSRVSHLNKFLFKIRSLNLSDDDIQMLAEHICELALKNQKRAEEWLDEMAGKEVEMESLINRIKKEIGGIK